MSDIVYPNIEEAPYGVARLGEKYTLTDIFEKFPKQEKNFNNYYSYLAFSTILGLALPVGLNHWMGKKLYFQPFVTISAGVAAFVACRGLFYYREQSAIRTEAVCRDYIRLHPDRFPPVGKCRSMCWPNESQVITKQLPVL